MKVRACLLFSIACLLNAAAQAAELTAQQVIDRMKANVGIPWGAGPTVDTFKDGDPNTPVEGIATCMMATFDVLKRAADQGANLIITHEPTFWGHLDSLEPLAAENDAVLQAKRDFIKEHKMVIFRFHDHIHQMKPDMIVHGVIRELGWEKFRAADSELKYVLPETTLAELAADIARKLGIRTVRVTGDPRAKVSRIGFSPGFSGFNAHRKLLQDDNVEVLVYGEAHEWETIEYMADAITAGQKKGLITMGHIPSEEAGMKECAVWMKTFVPEVPIHFISTPEPFWPATH